jgi:hypothetical protein
MRMGETVVGAFDERTRAEAALDALREAGFRAEDVGVVAPRRDADGDEPAGDRRPDDQGLVKDPDPTEGILAGGLLGGAAGWLAGAATVAVPGLGAFVAAGALAAAVSGAGLGATVGGLVDALTGEGVPEEEARRHEERARSGAILLTVRAGDRAQAALEIMRRHGGHDVSEEAAS